MTFPRQAWIKLNRLKTGVCLFRAVMHKWGLPSALTCDYGAKEQSANISITLCPTHHFPYGIFGIVNLDDHYVTSLSEKCSSNLRHQI